MKLTKIAIENFRAIRKLELDFGDITVLIGENNSGKTAVLDAIRIALRDLRSKRGLSFDPLDFHLKDATTEPASADPIKLTYSFVEAAAGAWSKDASAALNRAKVLQVATDGRAQVVLRVTARYDATAKDFVQDWVFLDLAGNDLAGADGRALNILQEHVSYFYLSALRDASRHFDAKGPYWRPFLKNSTLTPDQKKTIEDLLKSANDAIVTSHTSFETARKQLKQLQNVIPLWSGDVVSIDAVPARIFDMLAKAQISLGTTTGAKLPVERHGEGTQSLAVLMLFSAFLQAWGTGGPIVALEEPEAHLHPSAVRALWKLIEALPGQKILSTHSGDLISEIPITAMRRLRRLAGGVQVHQLQSATLDATQSRQFDFHVRHLRGELLFARCWLLVEGETETVLLPLLARHLGVDFQKAGVRCVPYRQADIDTYLKAASALGIQWCVLADNDQQGAKDMAKVTAALNGASPMGVVFQMPQSDIELYLCTSGFGAFYSRHLTQQTQQAVTVLPAHPDYWGQVVKAIKHSRGFSKPAAALEVAAEIEGKGLAVPAILESAIRGAQKLAEAG